MTSDVLLTLFHPSSTFLLQRRPEKMKVDLNDLLLEDSVSKGN